MAMAMGPERIDLSWTAPTDNGGHDITGYMIQYATLNADNGVAWQATGLHWWMTTGSD